jgi:asparagine synthase (glutamine-hydrolysing)
MCGIAGKLNFDHSQFVTPGSIARMCGVIRHRGPDDEGIYINDNFGMGMRRLSIIDLSTGKQPIKNEDGTIWTILNGEVYNYLELRSRLQRKGHWFYTESDTEVIVHLYEEYGERFVEHLAGMFAVAVWDTRQKQLTLARDRLGIKPLYYAADSNRLLFGSELKAILVNHVDRGIDLQALHDYLSFNYVPGPRTIFREIRSLPAGHVLTCTRGTVAVKRYWEVEYAAESHHGDRSEESYCADLYSLLSTVVKQHLISDVPLGVFLSGGVDSSTLVALMSKVSSQRVRTFSIGFNEQSYNELAYARAVAKQFDTEHHELIVSPDIVNLLPKLIRAVDQPFADSSAIPVYCVSKLAREHVKVVLSGEGGDEVFAGYQTYAAYRMAELYKRLPRSLAATVIPAIVKRLPVSHKRVSFDYRAKQFIKGALLSPPEGHYWWKVIFSEESKAELYASGKNGFADPLRLYREIYDACGARDPLTRLQHIDLTVYLADDILVKADRMSMANSLEARVPFLDHRVVEFAAALPSSLKLHGFTKKYVLRRTMARDLPPTVLNGKKRGFNVPIPSWLSHELRELVHEVLAPKRLKEVGFFRPEVVSTMIHDHERRHADYSRNIWCLLMFMLWHQEYAGFPRGHAQEDDRSHSQHLNRSRL